MSAGEWICLAGIPTPGLVSSHDPRTAGAGCRRRILRRCAGGFGFAPQDRKNYKIRGHAKLNACPLIFTFSRPCSEVAEATRAERHSKRRSAVFLVCARAGKRLPGRYGILKEGEEGAQRNLFLIYLPGKDQNQGPLFLIWS